MPIPMQDLRPKAFLPLLLLLLLATDGGSVPAQQAPRPAAEAPRPATAPTDGAIAALTTRLDAYLAQYQAEGILNGTVLVAEHGRVVLARGYGFADVEWRVPNAPDTRFRVASLTKAFTAMLVMQDVAAGRLRVDGRVGDYLPEYPSVEGRRITIAQLLNHSAGLPEYTWTADLIEAQVPDRPQDFIRRFAHDPLLFKPGTSFSYSNSGYYLLGLILERLEGAPYERILKERLLDPLGMLDSGYEHPQDVVPRMASGYLRVLAGRENPRYRYQDPGRRAWYREESRLEKPIYRDMVTLYAAGAMFSSAHDLYRWDRALASGRLLPPDLMQYYFRAGRGNYACGWFAARVDADQLPRFLEDFESFKPRPAGDATDVQWHTGSVNGFVTSMLRQPEHDRVVILLNNTGMTRLAEINAGLVALLDGRAPARMRRSVAEHAALAALQGGPEAGARLFRDLRENRDEYYVSQNELVTISGALQRIARPKEAVAVLEAGLETYPGSAKVLDHLAQAYLAAGDSVAARSATRRLLALLQDGKAVPAREREDLRRSASERLTRIESEGQSHATGAGEPNAPASPRG